MRDDDDTHGDDAEAAPGDPTPDGVAGGDVDWLHGTWRVAEVDDAALADGLQGPPRLTFEGDGQVYGYAGVNHVRGTWRLTEGRLEVGPVVQTMMAGPPEATATEQAVTALLEEGGSAERTGAEVRVRTPSGRVFRLTPAPEPDAPEPDPTAGPHVLG
ncbi:META domain-containing protein [Cellulomonas sp. JZ18]|uniref:META domain-containing protein n=1 Tax=Cellulomonas sp. JZ18 TaxID=2654191 RepID=UPI0012D499C5|nr:META domain-containing protein [Cellulomonas sp. JZ18]QGQ18854.1 META domain-containing protein [Cellulomonas sp. JZ18]